MHVCYTSSYCIVGSLYSLLLISQFSKTFSNKFIKYAVVITIRHYTEYLSCVES